MRAAVLQQLLLLLCAGARAVRAPKPRCSTARQESHSTRRTNLVRQLEPKHIVQPPDGPPEADPATPLALAAVRAADAKRAKDIQALRVTHLTSGTNYFVNMQGASKTQIAAIVKSVEDTLYDDFGRTGSRQGKPSSGWVCLDYDEVVVNIFGDKEREFYQVERLWSAAQNLDLSTVLQDHEDVIENSDELLDDGDDQWALAGDGNWDFGSDADWSLGDEDDWALGSSDDSSFTAGESPKDWSSANLEDEDDEVDNESTRTNGIGESTTWALGEEDLYDEEMLSETDSDYDEEEEGFIGTDWALGDDALRQMIETLEDSIDSDLDE